MLVLSIGSRQGHSLCAPVRVPWRRGVRSGRRNPRCGRQGGRSKRPDMRCWGRYSTPRLTKSRRSSLGDLHVICDEESTGRANVAPIQFGVRGMAPEADMSTTQLPLISSTALPAEEASDHSAFWSALKQTIRGEVRIDRLSRALYSTDASIYQIVPLGVVLPRTEEDVLDTLKACARFGVPLTARGGGTSQAGQCIGAGVILDCSKYFNEILEVNAAERWVRVRPGCVLDDLNQSVRPYGFHFAPDISTANRATIGGMIANNSSGTHSIVHGKTVDHVLELKVALADGSVIHARPLTDAELEEKCSLQNLEGQCYRAVRRLAVEHADEIERRFPKILRRVGGYNLDLFVESRRAAPRSPLSPGGRGVGGEGAKLSSPTPLPQGERGERDAFNLAHLFVGSEGTLGVVLEAKLRLIALPRARALLVVQFDGLLDALAAAPL